MMAVNTLSHLEFSLSELRSKYEQGRGQKALLQKQLDETDQELTGVQVDLETWRQVQTLFSKVSEYAREQLKARIEAVVTSALQAVFGEEGLAFQIRIGERAGLPVADWEVMSLYGDQVVVGEPETCRGGGVVDVISLALRLALLELSRPKPEGPVVLDEVGKHVSSYYAPNVALFLKEYCRKTGKQILLITHQDALAEVADKSYQVVKVNGESEVAVG